MKISVVLLLMSLGIAYPYETNGQNALISLKVRNQTVSDVLEKIENQSNYFFFYNNKEVDVNRKVSVNVDNIQIRDVLDIMFTDSKIQYSVLENSIILTNREISTSVGERIQGIPVTGTITDISGEPIPGVNVMVKGTLNGVVTDANGKYSITVSDRNAVLVFSFVGYDTNEVEVGDQTMINVNMDEDTREIEEVVVVGYGTTRKATVTGSISSVQGEKLAAIPSGNFSNALAGKFAGLTVITRSGQPGDDNSTLRVRGTNTLGNNDPLVVIDGIPGRDLNRINPADIDNMTVLKDASAAIYGARAANGVILITTKRGVAGKTTINANVRHGWSSPTITPEWANSADWATAVNEIVGTLNRPDVFSEEDIRKYADGSSPWTHPSTNWWDVVYKKMSPRTDADISLRGGGENIKYYASAAYTSQEGVFRNSAAKYDQVSIRSNVDAKVNNYINLGLDIAFRQGNRNSSTRGVFDLLRYGMGRPNRVAYYGPNKTLPASGFETGNNPAVIATDATGYDKRITYALQSNARMDVKIPWVEGLSVQGNLSYDKTIRNEKLWKKPWMLYTWDGQNFGADGWPEVTGALSGYADASLEQNMYDSHGMLLNAIVNYSRTFSSVHNVKAMAGIERNQGKSMDLMAYRRYFVSTELEELFAGGDTDKTNMGSSGQSARLTYFGRFNYDYAYKYLLEFMFRYDGSYIFDKGKQFGFFPAVSAGWVVSEENFWKNSVPFVNMFKIRGSWGQTGNDRINAYQYLASYYFNRSEGAGSNNSPRDINSVTTFNGSYEAKFLTESRIPNPNVTWEVANQSNIGFDMTMLKSRLRFSADYFYNVRTDILLYRNASIPQSSGITLPRENIGKTSNKGVEFDIAYSDKLGDFSYAVGMNVSFSKSRIDFWDEAEGTDSWQKATGKVIRTRLIDDRDAGLMYEAIGIFRDQAHIDSEPQQLQNAKPGDIIFKDINGDGKIDGADRYRSNKTDIPPYVGGLTIDVSWKGIYLSLGFQGSAGATRYHTVEGGELGNFSMEDWNGRWTKDNINASKPRPFNYNSIYWNQNNNTYFDRKADYIRLKNMELGYHLPSSVYSKLGLQGLRVYFSGLNLFTVTAVPFKTFDVETSSNTPYPMHKVMSLGLSLSF